MCSIDLGEYERGRSRERSRKWRKENKEHIRAYKRAYYHKNKERISQYKKELYQRQKQEAVHGN